MINYFPGRSPARIGAGQLSASGRLPGIGRSPGLPAESAAARAYAFRPSASTLPGDSGGRTSRTRVKPASVSQAA